MHLQGPCCLRPCILRLYSTQHSYIVLAQSCNSKTMNLQHHFLPKKNVPQNCFKKSQKLVKSKLGNWPKPTQISDSVKKNITGLYLKDFTYIYLHRKNFRHVSSGNRHFRNMWTKNYIAARVVGRSENPEG